MNRYVGRDCFNRYTVTITRLNGVSFEIHINTHSLEQATHIARDLLRDGETLTVEPYCA